MWVVTGDGDALSIGGNHLLHCLRRNVNLKILMINNQVYGLTKGQFSPTSCKGQITKTSPQGVTHEPINPLAIALAAGASFVARAVDKDPGQLGEILKQAHEHVGTAFVEIDQDCHIFNPGAFDDFSLKSHRADRTVLLRPGQPLVFGAEQQWALDLEQDRWQRVANDARVAYRHDPSQPLAAMRLATLAGEDLPVPLGVYYQQQRPIFALEGRLNKTLGDLPALFRAGASWRQGN